MKSNFLKRTMAGAIFVTVLVLCTLYGPKLVGGLFFIICLLGLNEFYNLSQKNQVHPQKIFGIIIGLFLFLYFWIRDLSDSQLFKETFPSIVLFSVSMIYIFELYRNKEKPFLNIAVTIFGVIYVALPFAFLMEIGHFKHVYEAKIILGILFLIWCNDTFAYLAGSLFGKHKLFFRISPGKTWEGFIGGAFAVIILASFMTKILPNIRGIETLDWLIIGTIIFSVGTLGDLIESMFKRSINVKDSGTLIAGHGGILDRFDSLLFSVPFIYGYLFLIKNNIQYLHQLLITRTLQ